MKNLIVTRDRRDFKNSEVPTLYPGKCVEQFRQPNHKYAVCKLTLREQALGLFHALNDLHAEGAIRFAIPAGNAIGSILVQLKIVRANALRYRILDRSQIGEFVHGSDIDAHRARLAVAAICALPKVCFARGGISDHLGKVALLFARLLISVCCLRLHTALLPPKNTRDRRTRQTIMDTLNRSERPTKR